MKKIITLSLTLALTLFGNLDASWSFANILGDSPQIPKLRIPNLNYITPLQPTDFKSNLKIQAQKGLSSENRQKASTVTVQALTEVFDQHCDRLPQSADLQKNSMQNMTQDECRRSRQMLIAVIADNPQLTQK